MAPIKRPLKKKAIVTGGTYYVVYLTDEDGEKHSFKVQGTSFKNGDVVWLTVELCEPGDGK